MEILLGLLATLSSISITSNCSHSTLGEFGGVYYPTTQSIQICKNVIGNKGGLLYTIYHELAHHYRFTVMTDKDKEEYRKVWELDEFYITEYAETMIEEDFAEMFSHMMYNPLLGLYDHTEKYKFVKRIFE